MTRGSKQEGQFFGGVYDQKGSSWKEKISYVNGMKAEFRKGIIPWSGRSHGGGGAGGVGPKLTKGVQKGTSSIVSRGGGGERKN